MDRTEHDVNIIITEQGVADLRGKSPKERAQAIIENCVHPDYKNILWDYLKLTDGKSQLHFPFNCAPVYRFLLLASLFSDYPLCPCQKR